LGDVATLTAPGGTTTFLRADKTWAVPPGGGGGGLTVEDVQDTVAAMFPTSASLDFTYNDTAGTIAAEVRFGGVTENHLSFSDTTADNASTGQHGLLPKLSGTPTQYLDGSGAWSTPAGGESYWTRGTGYSALRNSLVAYWTLDEASGTRADSAGANTLTDMGSVTQATGKLGQAAQFSGAAANYLRIADNAALSMGDIDFTVAAWVYLDVVTATNVVLSKGNDAGGTGQTAYTLQILNGQAQFFVGSGSARAQVNSSVTMSVSTWYWVCAWHDSVGNTINISVNDGTAVSQAWANGSFDDTFELCLGRYANYNGGLFRGRIDSVGIWKRLLTGAERTSLYNAGAGLDHPFAGTGAPALQPTTITDTLLLAPTATSPERLEVDGALKLGNALGTVDGTLRWSGTDFEGRKGGAWVSLVGGTMATQNANAVAITDGAISLGGHTPTGVLDVQGSVAASDMTPGRYFAVRIWPVAPSGAVQVDGLRVEVPTGAGVGSAGMRAICIADPPASTALVRGLEVNISSGTNRAAIHCGGTAPSYFGGTVQVVGTLGLNTPPVSTIRLDMLYAGGSEYAIQMKSSTASASTSVHFLNNSGTPVGSITHTTSATAYNTSSDARLKRNIAPLTDALARVQALRPVAFRWNADDSADEGFLAHEAQQVVPHAVQGLPDEVNPDGSIKPQQIDHSKLVVWLTAALQDTVAQLTAVTARVQALEEALGV
jgi:hypothetical protein